MYKIKTFDDLTEWLSIPLGLFGLYMCYLNYIQENYKELGVILIMVILITPKWIAFIRKSRGKNA